MKIRLYGVGEKKRRFHFALPNFLVFNRTTARLAVRMFQSRDEGDGDPVLNYEQVCALMNALQDGKRCLNGLPLLQVESSDGEQVEIYL